MQCSLKSVVFTPSGFEVGGASVLMCAYSVYVCLFFKQENMVSYSGWGEGSIVL